MTDYDAWLQKPYQDMYDAEATVDINCAELHDDEEDWKCDYEGEADAVVTDKSSGRRWWEITYEGVCPKCEASFVKKDGDEDDWGDD
jgi:hypothetical protein